MPRELYERRYWQRVEERVKRLGMGVESAWSPKSMQPQFIDYWSSIPATIPEKIVFAELVRRQINFRFSWYFGDMPITTDVRERWRPDFFLPDYNVIIEVYGVYWHSRPFSYENDANKAVIYTASGFKYYMVLDYEVLWNVRAALDRIPEINYGDIHGSMAAVGERPFNPKASVAARMRKWPPKYQTQYKYDRRMARTPTEASWMSRTGARRPLATYYPIFMGLGEETESEIDKWIAQWENYWDEYESYWRRWGWWLKKYRGQGKRERPSRTTPSGLR